MLVAGYAVEESTAVFARSWVVADIVIARSFLSSVAAQLSSCYSQQDCTEAGESNKTYHEKAKDSPMASN